jgi:hypothetical protein
MGAIVAVAVVALTYNAILAFASARQIPVSAFHVMAIEGALFAVVALFLVRDAQREGDSSAAIFLAFFVAGALLISLQSNGLFLPLARSAAIISLFLMAGSRIEQRHVRLMMKLGAALVFAGLALEIAFPSLYVRLFEPALYYELTRGIEPLETVDGLFRNASGFEGRFTIATLLGHRAGSLFLEPVSLGNFGVVLIGFLLSFWRNIGRGERVAYVALILLILVSTNSRILLAFILLAPLIYFAGGHFARPARLLAMPAILGASALIYALASDAEGDNLVGRIGLAMRSLADLDLAALAGMHSELAASATDSGYAYVIYAGSIFALLALWLFVSLIVPDTTPRQRRLGVFLTLYVFLNLLISGNSVFSIKVAALLWLLVGAVCASKEVAGSTAKIADQGRAKPGWRRRGRAEELTA